MDVLIVDDEPISRLAVAQTLQSAGYGVTVTCSGEEALGRLIHGGHQLVVCDWSMPGMNGLELCRTIRANTLRRYVYILMLTSQNRLQNTLEGLIACHASHLLASPRLHSWNVIRDRARNRCTVSYMSTHSLMEKYKWFCRRFERW